MLIVVVIIGILAAALVPRLTSVKDKANDVARKANLQQLVTAMSSYALDNGIPSFSGWDTSDLTNSGVRTDLNIWGMRDIPTDPTNRSASIYGKSTTGYIIYTMYKGTQQSGWFIFISRAETAAAANFVESTATDLFTGNLSNVDNLTLCSTVVESGAANNNCAGPKSNFRIIVKY